MPQSGTRQHESIEKTAKTVPQGTLPTASAIDYTPPTANCLFVNYLLLYGCKTGNRILR